MEKSALDNPEEIKQSFSFYISNKNTIDDVLLFEGVTDNTFYSRFPIDKKYSIFYRRPNDYEIKCTVKSLVQEMGPKGKNIYGIIDPDYSNAKDIPEEVRDRIHVIDANSLETLIVKYSDKTHDPKKAISNFNIIFRKRKIFQKKTCDYGEITEDVLKWSYYIGNIRKINDSKKSHLNFKLTQQQSNYYVKYIKWDNENPKQKIFDQEEYLKNLCEQSRYDDSFFQEIKLLIKDYNEEDVWDICQGHDIFDFIECFNPSYYPSKTAKGNMVEQKRTKSCPDWEENLLKAFDITAFQNSPLQDWFDEINSKVTTKPRIVVKVTK